MFLEQLLVPMAVALFTFLLQQQNRERKLHGGEAERKTPFGCRAQSWFAKLLIFMRALVPNYLRSVQIQYYRSEEEHSVDGWRPEAKRHQQKK